MCVNFIELCVYSADGDVVKINERFGIRSSFPEVGEFELRIAPEVAAQFPELPIALSTTVLPWSIYEIWRDVCESPETVARMVLFHTLFINTGLWIGEWWDWSDREELEFTVESLSEMHIAGAIADLFKINPVEKDSDWSGLITELRQLLASVNNSICTASDTEYEAVWGESLLTDILQREDYLSLNSTKLSLTTNGILLSFLVELEAGEFGLPDDPEYEEETGD